MQGQAQTPAETRAQRLARLTHIFEALPEGKALLALAKERDCTITLDNIPQADVPGTLQGVGGRCGFDGTPFLDLDAEKLAYKRPTDTGYKITLDDSYNDSEIIELLAHELRHLWQYTIVPPENLLNLAIPQLLAATRVMEGDAYTFQKYIVARLTDPAVKGPADFDWKKAFVDFQESGTAVEYDRQQIERARLCFSLICDKISKNIIDMDKAKRCAAGVFNRHSLPDLRRLPDMLAAGQSGDAPNYMNLTACQLIRKTLECMDPDDLRVARESMQGVNPDMGKVAREKTVTFRPRRQSRGIQ